MDKQNMEALLDRVYELEGLLHLALSREDAPQRLQEIIRLKGQRIAEIIADTPAPTQSSQPSQDSRDSQDSQNSQSSQSSQSSQNSQSSQDSQSSHSAPDATPMLEEEEEMAEAWDEITDPEPKAPETAPASPLKSRFSLNDRFRFSRELFGGDTRGFDRLVETLQEMPNFDEARHYLADTLGWDIESDDAAAEFVEIINPFYK